MLAMRKDLTSYAREAAIAVLPPVLIEGLRKIVRPVKNWISCKKFSGSDRNVRSDQYIQWLCGAVGGWLTPEHGNVRAFDYALRHIPSQGAIVEVGSFLGLSTNIIAYLVIKYKLSNQFYTCDHWRFEGTEEAVGGYFDGSTEAYRTYAKEVFKMNTALFSERRKPYTIEVGSDEFFKLWRAKSVVQDVFGRTVTLGGPISFAYVDGAHTYRAVKNDFLAIDECLVPGGFILFDDSAAGSGFEGVTRAVREVRNDRPYEQVFATPHEFLRKKF